MNKASYVLTDGTLVLNLKPAGGGWYAVTSPIDPHLITQARSIEEAFVMAYDAQKSLADARKALARRLSQLESTGVTSHLPPGQSKRKRPREPVNKGSGGKPTPPTLGKTAGTRASRRTSKSEVGDL